MSLFDRLFGPDFLASVPNAPGVYLYRNTKGEVIYVGKARNLRKRLQQYRAAPPTKKGRKARRIVKASKQLEVHLCPSELDALLEENKLIQQLRPKFNVANAYTFLYPFLGLSRELGLGQKERLTLALGTHLEELQALETFGVYRDRALTRLTLDALVELLGLVGHLEEAKTLKALRGTAKRARLRALRRIPSVLVEGLRSFLRGESKTFLEDLTLALLESDTARAQASTIHLQLRVLERFFHTEAEALRLACQRVGFTQWPVPQTERDALFLKAKAKP